MSRTNELFEKGNIWKVLIKFSMATIFSILVTELYNMVDTIFVGRVVGSKAIGALVVVFPIQRIVAAMSMMVAVGSATTMGRRSGLGDHKGVKKAIENSIYSILMLMVPFVIFTYTFRKQLLILLGASENILPYAIEYLSIIIWSSIFLALSVVMNHMMMSSGNRKITLISTSVGAITNIIIDYLLVVNFNMGVRGAALATFISQILVFLISFVKYMKTIIKSNGIKFDFKLNWSFIALILTVGFSAFIVEAEDGLLLGILNNLLANNVNEESVIVLGVISKISMFMFINMFGIGSGMQPLVAYNFGAKNYDRLHKVLRRTIILSVSSSLLLWGFTMYFTPQIISIFVKEREIIELATNAFRTFAFCFPLLSIYYIAIFFYQSIGMAKRSLIMSLMRQILVVMPLSIILIKFVKLGALGAWISYPIGDLVAGTIAIYFLRTTLKKLDKINV